MAGNRIKGITVEIGGDTTKLQNALRGVNSEIKSTESQLRDVNKLLKLDPGNTELLAQKHRLLADAVEGTKEKLETLKTAQEQANQALKDGTISQDQYDGLKREIVETEADLKKLEEQAKQSATALQKIADTGTKLQDVGNKVSGVGKKMLPVTGAVVGIGTASAKMASGFEDAMAKVSTIADSSEVPMDEMKKSILTLSNQTGISSDEIANNVYDAISAGQKTGDAVNFVSNSTKLAKAGFADAGDALNILTTILNAYGLKASEVTNVSDMLIQTQNLGKTTVAELSSAMGKVIPTANAYNVGLDQLCTGYAIMTANGVATAESTTYMNSMLNELGKSGTTVSGILKEKTGSSFAELMAQGYSLSDCLSIIGGAASEQGLAFGDMWSSSEAAKAGLILLGDSAETFNGTLSKMQDSTGATDTAFEKLKTNSYVAQVAVNELKNAAIDLGGSILEVLAPVFMALADMISSFTQWFSGLSNGAKSFLVIIALVIAAVGPLLIIVGKVMSAVGTIMTTAPQIAGAVKGVSSAIGGISSAASGIGTVLQVFSGIGLVIGGVVTAVKNFIDMFQNGFSAVKDVIMGIGIAIAAVGAVILGAPAVVAGIVAAIVFAVANAVILIKEHWTEILTFFSGLWDNIKTLAGTAWQAVSDTISSIVTGIAEFLSGVWESISSTASSIWDSISSTVGGIVQGLVDTITSIWQGFADTFGPLLEAFKYLFETIFEAIQILIGRAMEAVGQKIQEIWNGIVSFLTPLLTALQSLFQTIWTAIQTAIETVLTAIKGVVETVWNAISSVVSTVLDTILGVVTSIWNSIKDYISSAMDNIKETVSNIWNNVKDAVSSIIDQIYDTIHGGFEKAVEYVKGLASSAFQWGADIIGGIVDGIQSKVKAITDAVTGVADNIRSVLHFSVPDEGPLTDYESWMPDFMAGLAKGIEQSRGLVSDAISGVAADMVLSPTVSTGSLAMAGAAGMSGGTSIPLLQSIADRLDSLKPQDGGDIMIPVYIGQERIDEIVVSATQRANYRSGGR